MLTAILKWTARIIKWISQVFLFGIVAGGMAACTMLSLNYASLETDNKSVPSPAISPTFDRASARATLEEELFGPWPGNLPTHASSLRVIDDNYLNGRGTLEEVMVTIGAGETARTFPVVIAFPKIATDQPVPLIISQTFADNCSVFPDDPVTGPDGAACTGSNMGGAFGFAATQIFGTYIAHAPVARYLDAGLAYASFDGSSLVPDNKSRAPDVMANLGPGPAPTSTLMAWAYGYEAAADTFAVDPRIRGGAIAAMGHSRYGKSSLIASGWSNSIAAAITHQSGFAGAASSRSTTGETLERMAATYPHWLRPGLAGDLKAGTILTLDQHYFLALSAPKPIFLGNGRRDVWSDPNSTYRMAQAADEIYEASGVSGLPDGDMRTFEADAEIAYWLRVGGHSVVSEDIDAYIAFMNAHFQKTGGFETALQTAQ